MKAFTAPMRELGEFEEISKKAASNRGLLQVTGCIDSQKSHFVYCMSEEFGRKKAESAQPSKNRSATGGALAPVITLIVTYNDLRAKEMYENYRFFDRNVLYFPAKDLIFFQADIHSNLLEQQRVQVLKALAENTLPGSRIPDENSSAGTYGKPHSEDRFEAGIRTETAPAADQELTIITTIAACMNRMVPFEEWAAHVLEIGVAGSDDGIAAGRDTFLTSTAARRDTFLTSTAARQDSYLTNSVVGWEASSGGSSLAQRVFTELDTEQLKKDLIGMGYE
ncbi:MAG: hypothetical protein LUG93_10070, partial [Lachnospiraceae bacterium]|nr:hypothetical protein [Lachnospiraceae bacterium]